MTLKAVFLDFHGTVLNDARLRESLTEELLVAQNLRPNPQDYQQFCIGRRDRACLNDLLQQRGRFVNDEILRKLVQQKNQLYCSAIAALPELTFYPGIEPFIRKLVSANLKIGLLTALSTTALETVLARIDWHDCLDVRVTADEEWQSSPEPDGYTRLLAKLQVSEPTLTPQNCLVVDHTIPGMTAAHQAGMRVVGITHTYPLHIVQRHASWVVDKFSELELERVETLFAQQNASSLSTP